MRQRAFTLIELLAVIVILAIILAIAIPSITGIVNNAKKNAFEDNAKLLIKAINNQKAYDETFNYTALDKDKVTSILNVPNDNYKTVVVETSNNKPSVTIVGQNKWEGLTVTGTYDSLTVSESETTTPSDTTPPVITLVGDDFIMINEGATYTDAGATATDDVDGDITSDIVVVSTVNASVGGTYTVTYNVSDAAGNAATEVVRTINVISDYVASEGVNRPKLASGMTAIKWDGSNWVDVTNPDTDTSWYDYTNKEWANAKTSDGSYWVWIPRYVYRISSNWNTSTTGTIDIQFSMITDDTRGGTVTLDTGTTSNASNNKWTNHPAFNFGGTELTGFWVAKFEASNDGSDNVKIAPNLNPWASIYANAMFNYSRSMETTSVYGWGTSGNGIDTHLMKNIEWGAVAYLTKSTYGKNTTEVWKNPVGNPYITGCAGTSVSPSTTTTCNYPYNTSNGLQASTTGTIYGIYDMYGGVEEYLAAYLNSGHSNLSTYASSILNADTKYKDIYSVGTSNTYQANYDAAISHKGDAVYETSIGSTVLAWYSDRAYMLNNTGVIMTRGGNYNAPGSDGGMFNYDNNTGNLWNFIGFRPTLLVKQGL